LTLRKVFRGVSKIVLSGVGRPYRSTEVPTHQQITDDCLFVFENNRDRPGCVSRSLQHLCGNPVIGEVVAVVEFDVVLD
jgi:hypothetical protein